MIELIKQVVCLWFIYKIKTDATYFMLVLKITKSIIIDSNHKKTYPSHWLTYQQEYPMELLYTAEQVNKIYKCIPTWPAIFEVKNN